MEHAIGEIITLPDGRKAQVVEGIPNSCAGCFLEIGYECSEYAGECNRLDRIDHKDIIYREIKEK